MSATIPRLMLVTDRGATGGRSLVEVVSAAVDGGADAVQVREKDLADGDLRELVTRVKEAVAGRALVLVNGRSSIAVETGVGLHLPAGAPAPLRQFPVWGRSVHSPGEAARRAEEGPGYLLVGHVFETESKPGLAGRGPVLVRGTAAAAGRVPVLAIGGIDESNAGDVIDAGAAGVAVRGAILHAREPGEAARSIREAVDRGLAESGGRSPLPPSVEEG